MPGLIKLAYTPSESSFEGPNHNQIGDREEIRKNGISPKYGKTEIQLQNMLNTEQFGCTCQKITTRERGQRPVWLPEDGHSK